MSETKNRGWTVTLAGTGINLALGVLYSWSTIKKEIPAAWDWSDFQKSLPYTVACLAFAFMMVPSGRLQDKFGPRVVASIGGVLTGLGLILAALFANSDARLIMFVIGFGIFAGSGIGFGYASASPPAVKWFPPAKTGMIVGIVVSGFGLASVYISPLVKYLIKAFSTFETAMVDGKEVQNLTQSGIPTTLLILGIAFLIVVVALAQLLVNPPSAAPKPAAGSAPAASGAAIDGNYTASEMLKTPQFFMLWFMFAVNAGAGLMIIGQLASLIGGQAEGTFLGMAGKELGFVLVALLAIGNAGGRLLAGSLSDKLGRITVLLIFTVTQCVLMFVTPSVSSILLLIPISMLIGACYGSNLALFPAFTKDFFGLKNFGVNYGLVFTSWGIGSLMALLAGYIKGATGKYDMALYIAGGLLIITMVISQLVKKPQAKAA